MNPTQPRIVLEKSAEYRDDYANSVQIRVNLWDFFMMFGRLNQTSADTVNIENFQGIYVSPQQAKALLGLLQQNVSQYEAAFGEIRLEPKNGAGFIQLEAWLGENNMLFLRRNNAEPLVVLPWRVWARLVKGAALPNP